MHSGSAVNDSHYANTIVAAVLDTARPGTDPATRIAAYLAAYTR